jgi:hypothetical protein
VRDVVLHLLVPVVHLRAEPRVGTGQGVRKWPGLNRSRGLDVPSPVDVH